MSGECISREEIAAGVRIRERSPAWNVYYIQEICRRCVEHTPMKYSALEVLSTNLPTVSMRYEDAIEKYMEFPKMEWICKMGLNKIAKGLINSRYSGYQTGKVNVKGNTIYEILGLTKVNTRVLQCC